MSEKRSLLHNPLWRRLLTFPSASAKIYNASFLSHSHNLCESFIHSESLFFCLSATSDASKPTAETNFRLPSSGPRCRRDSAARPFGGESGEDEERLFSSPFPLPHHALLCTSPVARLTPYPLVKRSCPLDALERSPRPLRRHVVLVRPGECSELPSLPFR